MFRKYNKNLIQGRTITGPIEGFEDFSLQQLKLNVFHINTRAIQRYERAGFVKGQISKNVYQSLNSDYWNAIEMTLTKELCGGIHKVEDDS